jgi:NAD dependent epimerase/dehydratase family
MSPPGPPIARWSRLQSLPIPRMDTGVFGPRGVEHLASTLASRPARGSAGWTERIPWNHEGGSSGGAHIASAAGGRPSPRHPSADSGWRRTVRILLTGGGGVLGRATLPLLRARGHEVHAPEPPDIDLFDPTAVTRAVDGAGAILHLATRIPPADRSGDREAWRENDRLRSEASQLLVDAALAAGTETYVQPSVAFLRPREGSTRRRRSVQCPIACGPPWRLRRRPLVSRPRVGVASFYASDCSTVPEPPMRCRTIATAPPCIWPTRGAQWSRR